jgi:hypothetical protein
VKSSTNLTTFISNVLLSSSESKRNRSLAYSSTLKMEAVRSSETSVNICLKGGTRHSDRRENLKSHTSSAVNSYSPSLYFFQVMAVFYAISFFLLPLYTYPLAIFYIQFRHYVSYSKRPLSPSSPSFPRGPIRCPFRPSSLSSATHPYVCSIFILNLICCIRNFFLV